MQKKYMRGSLVAVVAAVLSIGITACTGSDTSLPELPNKNADRWVLPLDEYMFSPLAGVKLAYAGALLSQPCLDDKGFVQDVPWRDFSDPDENSRLHRNLTEENAALYGYHSESEITAKTDPWVGYAYREMSGAEQTALTDCQSVVDSELPPLSGDALNLGAGFANAAFEAALEDKEVIAATGRWAECMKPEGIIDLPDEPGLMPSDSLESKFSIGIQSTGDVSISGVEKKLASADFACRASSGYLAARYDAEWELQVAALTENATALKDVRDEIAKKDLEVDEIISAHASQSR